ncbi:transposase [Nocardia mangyaensis]|uniref:IS701 family transposase n=1 Tax=Nocardia mangyaensis TaxID=2213200 RepID=UPI00090389CB
MGPVVPDGVAGDGGTQELLAALRCRGCDRTGRVAADSAYGRDGKFRSFCEARRLSYVLEVPVRQTVNDLDGRRRVDTLVGRAPADAWHRVSAGLGERGERVYGWAWATLPSFGDIPVGFSRTLLVRRSIDDPTDIAYYLCFHPATVTREQIIAVAGARWAVEECFQAAKDRCSLDHYQVRKWIPWYRHITLAMLAHAFLAVTAATDRAGSNHSRRRPPSPGDSPPPRPHPHPRSGHLPMAAPPPELRPTTPISKTSLVTQRNTTVVLARQLYFVVLHQGWRCGRLPVRVG